MKGHDKSSGSIPSFGGLGTFVPPPDARVPIVKFEADGGLTFEQMVIALDNGLKGVHIRVWKKDEFFPRHGNATEVDESGIVRVEHVMKHGVIVLLSVMNGQLLGEFTD